MSSTNTSDIRALSASQTLLNSDAFAEFSKLPDKSVDVVITSPPFEDRDVVGDYYVFYDKFMSELKRVTRDYAFVFNSSKRLAEISRRYDSPDIILIWYKGVIVYANRYNPIFVYRFTDKWKIRPWSNIFRVSPYRNNDPTKLHEHQDPVLLYKYLLRLVPDDKVVLDPFCGSGTLLVAARGLNRTAVGWEIDTERYNTALSRLKTPERTHKLSDVY